MTQHRYLSLSAAALATSVSLVAMSATAGDAATVVAQAQATGLRLTVLSQPATTGSYTVTNDGKKETSTGTNKPLITALGKQPFLSVGTLAQDAKTSVDAQGRGKAVACAGLAGDGASLVSAGSGNECLSGGQNVSLSAGTLDLSKLSILSGDVTKGLPAPLAALLSAPGALAPVLAAVQTALQTTLTTIGNPDIELNLGTIQSHCLATTTRLAADSDLTQASLQATIAGQKVDLVEFPTHPRVNTKVLTNLDKVVDAIDAGLQTQLTKGLNGALGALAGPTQQLITAINNNVISALAPQLAPLEQNVLDGTLNEQSRTGKSITVTAADIKILPAAQSFGLDALSAQIGESECGPVGKVATVTPPHHTNPPHHSHNPGTNPGPGNGPAPVPTTVSAGVNGSHGSPMTPFVILGLVGAAGAAGAMRFRHLRRS